MTRPNSNHPGLWQAAKFALWLAVVLIVTWPLLVRSQANQFRIGVLPFVDNTGTGGGDVANSVSRAVQAEMSHSTQLQGRVLTLTPGLDPSGVDGDNAVAMGRAQNVDVVVVGTVLEANSEESSGGASGPSVGGFSLGGRRTTMKASVTLQADLYNTSTGQKIDSIRQTGNASQAKIGADTNTSLGGLSTDGNFDNSTIGKAFHSAVIDLVKKINSEQPKMARYTGGGAAAVTASAAGAAQAGAPAAAATSPGTATAAPAGAAGGQPVLSAVRIDFVPGERTVFFDDFSDMAPDEPPPHWKLRGNPVELRMGGGIRELYADGKDTTNLASGNFAVPNDFTFELTWDGTGQTVWRFKDKDDQDILIFTVRGEPDGTEANLGVEAKGDPLGSGGIMADDGQPISAALWVQQGRVRAYMNGQRLVDVNQVAASGITHVNADIGGYRPNGIRSIRIAESAPDFATVIAASGKYVTHGIFFDTDSDHLKPESAPIIKQVAGALIKNPALKLEIDGYTDSVGDAAHNLDLSKRRAQAVQSVLVSQFDIDASRLSSNGLGATKPIASNDTPDGRANNRRVEFVKK